MRKCPWSTDCCNQVGVSEPGFPRGRARRGPAGGRVAPERGVARPSPRKTTAEDAVRTTIVASADLWVRPDLGRRPPRPLRVPVIGAIGLSYPRPWYRHFSQWLCKHEPSSREAAPFLHFPLECTELSSSEGFRGFVSQAVE